MSVYVDSARHRFGLMLMSHMVADTHQELMDMAKTIGVQPRWLQHPGTFKEHFDICQSKRQSAIVHGAKIISQTDLGKLLWKRRLEDYAQKTQSTPTSPPSSAAPPSPPQAASPPST